MLLPMLLRTLISGAPSQGETTRKELSRVAVGVPEIVTDMMGIKPMASPLLDEGVADVDPGTSATTDSDRFSSALSKSEAAAAANGKEGVKIGWFLHTPFPSSEIYRILPVRREILLGVLQCDLIGFHTYDYARHFLSSCTRILGLPTMPNGVAFEGRYAHVGTFPIGIEPMQFVEGLQKPKVTARLDQLLKRFEGVKVIIGVDRLDYIKGVPQKLHALEIFLAQHPEWIGKVVLVQLAIPSRGDVEEYQNLRSMVNELVGRINGRFGTVEFMPIHFMHTSVPFDELTAMYALADACLVTSTRDGMNLVAYEYISAQVERHGVMILSEFAGAAQSFNGSLIINPWDVQGTADAIHQAVTMPAEQRKSNHEKLWKYVSKNTSEAWGTSFVNERESPHQLTENDSMLITCALVTRISGEPPAPPQAKQAVRRKSRTDSIRSMSSSAGGGRKHSRRPTQDSTAMASTTE